MASINIDNMLYDLDTLSDDAKAQLQSLQFCDADLLHRVSSCVTVLRS